MEKRFTALLLTVCVLLSLCAPASGQDGVCASTEEFVRQIRYHVSSGETAFSVLCDQATYDKLRADGDQPLRTAILQGGMREFSGCEIISRRNVYTFSFSGAVFSTYCYCGSTEEFRTLLDTLAGQQAADFTVQCDPALYRKLMERDCAVLNGINGCCGLYRPQLTYSDDTCSLYYGACEYYPGFRVYQMYISGRESELNGTERELLDTAKDLVNSLKGSTGLETELAIHDMLCRTVTYQTGPEGAFGAYDTAVGALLNGQADCDGYSDAFFLLCSLAGIPVRTVIGYMADPASGAMKGHAWNLVSQDGGITWYMVDVTNDSADREIPVHFCFNTGKETAFRSYVWEEEAVPDHWALAENDSLNYGSGLFGSVFDSAADAARYTAENSGDAQTMIEVRINGLYSGDEINEALLSALRERWKNSRGFSYGYRSLVNRGGYTWAVLCVNMD